MRNGVMRKGGIYCMYFDSQREGGSGVEREVFWSKRTELIELKLEIEWITQSVHIDNPRLIPDDPASGIVNHSNVYF